MAMGLMTFFLEEDLENDLKVHLAWAIIGILGSAVLIYVFVVILDRIRLVLNLIKSGIQKLRK